MRSRAFTRGLLTDRRVRYVLAGGLSSGIYYVVFAGLWLGSRERIPYLLVAVLANLCTAVAIYPVNRLVVFRVAGPWLAGFLRFYVLSVWALLFTLGGLPLLVEVGQLDVLPAQAMVLAVSALLNYQISRRWVFRHRPPAQAAPAGPGSCSVGGLARLDGLARLGDEGTHDDPGLRAPRQDQVRHLER